MLEARAIVLSMRVWLKVGCRSLSSFDANPTLSSVLRTIVGFFLSSMRATVASARLHSKILNWLHTFWTTITVNRTASVSNFLDHHFENVVSIVLRSQPWLVRILSMNDLDHRDRVLKLQESSKLCNEGGNTSPTEFYIGSPISSCADEEVGGSGRCAGTNSPWSESLTGPSGRTKRHRWKSHGGRRGRQQRQLLRNLYQERKQTKSEKIESPPSTASDSSALRPPEVRFSGYDVGEAGSHYPRTNALQSISRETSQNTQ